MGTTTPMGLYKPAVGELNYGVNVNADIDALDWVMQGLSRPGWTFAYVSTTSFTIVGDKTPYIAQGQILFTVDNAGTRFLSFIKDTSYSSGSGLTTVTTANANVPATLSSVLFATANITGNYILMTNGSNVTSNATIVPTGQIFHVTGTTQSTLMAIPYAHWTGQVTVIPDAAWTTATGGTHSGLNYPFRLATTGVQYKAITFTFDGTYWYPSY